MRPRRARLKLSALTLVACFAAAPATAGAATTFGANLARPANSTATCITAQTIPTLVPSCSAESVNLATGESGFPPGGEGVVSVVRVKVGPVTGPMQIVEEEALRKDNPGDPGHPTYACCRAVAVSQVFTPAANAVTAVPVNFRVKQSLAPEESGYYVDQHLSLSVLDPNVPIPASIDPNASVSLWFPAWQVGEERAGGYGTSGAVVLFNADWDPVSAAGGAGGAGNAGTAGPAVAAPVAVRFPSNAATVRNGQALVPLVCQLTTACIGRLLLQSQQAGAARVSLLAGAAKAGKPKALTYASVKFDVPAGQKVTVKAKLGEAGRKLLKGRSQAKAWANVKIKGQSVPPFRVTLKKAAAK